eukprot:CAMPEP_0197628816 /NCGR_PEP_ID=MMETSP1338-20131121/6953_1 /TAXON_ID=43686 ORGANISM="Pelagodinium beii, Strain RCC1491" /NCGR_SAMPLE_ID=MMETSP1338 /ASSEMBLY_ACC=CAM_ASM_000754 /LENGTH=160 /DNA_ID=CAMNT_0043199815 /DNA_START=86 /DNA_END=564 /DNA_ORIENTATION=+
MSGPCGGVSGAVRTFGKGQSQRKMPTRGVKLGSYVRVHYRLPGKQSTGQEEDMHDYEGKLVNKRIGAEDRESFVELKECLQFDLDGNFLGMEKTRRLIDAFIEKCEVCEKRDPLPQLAPEGSTAVGSTAKAAADDDDSDDDTPAMMPGMMPAMMGMMMPG